MNPVIIRIDAAVLSRKRATTVTQELSGHSSFSLLISLVHLTTVDLING
jgi:hypothetical protein